MSMTSVERATKAAELSNELLALHDRIAEVERDLGNLGFGGEMPPKKSKKTTSAAAATATETNADGTTKKRRGRPPGSGKKTTDGGSGEESTGRTSLADILCQIGQETKSELLLADIVKKAREAGYETKSKNFSNMVYQALIKLMNAGKFNRNNDTMGYTYAA